MLKRASLLILLSYFVHQKVATALPRYLPEPDTYKIFNLGPGCRFKIHVSGIFKTSARYDDKEPFGSAGFGIEGLRLPQGIWGINFRCTKSDGEFAADAAAVFRGDRWQLNNNNDENKQLIKYNTLRFFSMNANGENRANGWAITYDDSFGEEKFRQRNLFYCLIRARKALCGASAVGYLESIEKNRKTDFTEYVLKLLKTVEFLDDAVPDRVDNPEAAVK